VAIFMGGFFTFVLLLLWAFFSRAALEIRLGVLGTLVAVMLLAKVLLPRPRVTGDFVADSAMALEPRRLGFPATAHAPDPSSRP